MIPKIIHYCWFGNGSKPKLVRECIDSFSIIEDSKVMVWDERRCNFNENEFIKAAFQSHAWAFVSDFYRLKALYEYGGIYLDTDVKITKPFEDDFYKANMVLGYMYDCALSTAVIMAKPHHPIIKRLLDWYQTANFDPSSPNNSLLTDYLIFNYPTFKLNGKFCEFDKGCFIYPKEYFEVPILFPKLRSHGGGYSVHFFSQFWKEPKGLKRIIRPFVKELFFHCNLLNWLFNKYSRRKSLITNTQYYERYLKDIGKNRV